MQIYDRHVQHRHKSHPRSVISNPSKAGLLATTATTHWRARRDHTKWHCMLVTVVYRKEKVCFSSKFCTLRSQAFLPSHQGSRLLLSPCCSVLIRAAPKLLTIITNHEYHCGARFMLWLCCSCRASVSLSAMVRLRNDTSYTVTGYALMHATHHGGAYDDASF